MERYHKSEDRNQLSIQLFCLDDIVSPDAEVRALEVVINHMDIRFFGFTHTHTCQTGCKHDDPVDIFKIYAYSYDNVIRSSRKIECECSRNLELMWLVNGIRPDFKTFADFRKDNEVAIVSAYRRLSLMCSELGLTGKEMVARCTF